jgi:prepilin signal peptidase PulO-like enzyme (type II secretory pathway)
LAAGLRLPRAHPAFGGPVIEWSHVQDIFDWPIWYLAVLALFGLLFAAVAVHDVRHRRIPNAVTYPAIIAGTGLALLQPLGPWWTFVVAGAAAGVSIGALALLTGGIGFGDAKLAIVVGLLLGWPSVLIGLFVAFAVGALMGVALTVAGRLGRGESLPFAPALAIGALVGLLGGPTAAHLLWPGLA